MARTKARQRARGEGHVWKKCNRFYLKVRQDGRVKYTMLRNDDNSPCTTKPQAVAAADKLTPALAVESRQELAAFNAVTRKLRATAKPLALTDAWDAFLKSPGRSNPQAATLRNYKMVFDSLVRWAAGQGIASMTDITPDVAGAFLADVTEGLSPRRYNEYVGVLKMIFNCLADRLVDENPFAAFKRRPLETVRHEALTPEQARTILLSFRKGFFKTSEMERLGAGRSRERVSVDVEWVPLYAEEMEVLFYLLAYTGARLGDCCKMRWSAVDLAAGTLAYVPSKTRRRVNQKIVLPIHNDLRRALTDALAWRDNQQADGYILPNVSGRYERNPSGLSKNISEIISLALGTEQNYMPDGVQRKLKASRYSAHSFRHHFATTLAEGGIPLATIQALTGHQGAAMALHYQRATPDAKTKAIAALPSLDTAEPESAGKSALLRELGGLAETLDAEKLQDVISALKKS